MLLISGSMGNGLLRQFLRELFARTFFELKAQSAKPSIKHPASRMQMNAIFRE
jgi:hypothetical protein